MPSQFRQFPTPRQTQIASQKYFIKTLKGIYRGLLHGQRNFMVLCTFTSDIFSHLTLSDWHVFDIQTSTNPQDNLNYFSFAVRPVDLLEIEKIGKSVLNRKSLRKKFPDLKITLQHRSRKR